MSATRAPAGLRPTHYRLERLASLNRQALGLADVDQVALAPLRVLLQKSADVLEQLLHADRIHPA